MSRPHPCPGCEVGDHARHAPDYGILPGVIGGSRCPCTGDCAPISFPFPADDARPTTTSARTSLEARFWAKVDQGDGTGCWLWTGARDGRGYGHIRPGGKYGSPLKAHRVAYELLVGPIPGGHELDHVKSRGCTSTLCVNPDHLEPVTHKTNVLRGTSPAAVNATKTTCQHGHQFYSRRDRPGTRGCRTCDREAAARGQAQHAI